jgi:hypothetical protein
MKAEFVAALVVAFCVAVLGAGLLAAQEEYRVEDVVFSRTLYPPAKASELPVGIEAGETGGEGWNMKIVVRNFRENYEENWETLTCRGFVDDALEFEIPQSAASDPFYVDAFVAFPDFGDRKVLVQLWREDETQPVASYQFDVRVLSACVSDFRASSVFVRGAENGMAVSFANTGNESMRRVALAVASVPEWLSISPEKVELGDVSAGAHTSADLVVTAPSDAPVGACPVQFVIDYLDYAGVRHEERCAGSVTVVRAPSSLSLSVPGSAEVDERVEISAILSGPGGYIANEDVEFFVGGVSIGSSRTGADGKATVGYSAEKEGSLTVDARFLGSDSYEGSSASAQLTVSLPETTLPQETTAPQETAAPSGGGGGVDPVLVFVLVFVMAGCAGLGLFLYARRRRRELAQPPVRQ